jgi:hypothetical protein
MCRQKDRRVLLIGAAVQDVRYEPRQRTAALVGARRAAGLQSSGDDLPTANALLMTRPSKRQRVEHPVDD